MLRQGGCDAVKGCEHPLKALGQIFLYLAATVLIGALLAPVLFWMAHAAVGYVGNEWLTEFVAKTEFLRYFHRAMTVTALGLLWPLMRMLRIENFREDLGLKRDRWGWHRLTAGVVAALGMLLALAGILIFTGVYRMHTHMQYGKLAWVPVTAAVVGVLEEFMFRGVLQGVVRKTTMDGFAMGAVAVLFAAVHFLSPNGTNPVEIHWWSGLALLPDTLGQFRQPALFLAGFSTMVVVGLALGYARLRTRSLWMPVGLHAGWVAGKMGLLLVTRQSVAWPWVGPDILIGLGPLATVLATWGIVWWMLKDVRR
jgi:membrane protease YdiL (CAAX protease family)